MADNLTVDGEHAQQAFEEACTAKIKELEIRTYEALLVRYIHCGMPSWKAMETIVEQYPEALRDIKRSVDVGSVQGIDALNTWSRRYLSHPKVNAYRMWFEAYVAENEDIVLDNYHWTFRSSEEDLRFLIDASKATITKGGIANPQTSGAMLNAIKELNAMYRFTGTKATDTVTYKVVVFAGEGELLQ